MTIFKQIGIFILQCQINPIDLSDFLLYLRYSRIWLGTKSWAFPIIFHTFVKTARTSATQMEITVPLLTGLLPGQGRGILLSNASESYLRSSSIICLHWRSSKGKSCPFAFFRGCIAAAACHDHEQNKSCHRSAFSRFHCILISKMHPLQKPFFSRLVFKKNYRFIPGEDTYLCQTRKH